MALVQRTIELEDFARRVERLCEFIIERSLQLSVKEDIEDLRAIQDLKSDAADLQFHKVEEIVEEVIEEPVITVEILDGLRDYLNGASIAMKE